MKDRVIEKLISTSNNTFFVDTICTHKLFMFSFLALNNDLKPNSTSVSFVINLVLIFRRMFPKLVNQQESKMGER